MYAKLVNGTIRLAPKQVQYNGNTVINPSDDILQELGYLPVVYTDMPTDAPEGWHYESGWEQTETKIVQIWTLADDPGKVSGPEPLESVIYEVQPDGHADVWIRQNQTEVDGTYIADEIYLKVTAGLVSKDEIEADVEWWFNRLKNETEEIYADALCIPTVMADKRTNLSQICEQTIYTGIDVTLASGETEHFSLTEKDQINLFGKQVQLASGATKLEYHQDGHPCKYYDAADMQNILTQALAYVSYHTTYCNSMFQWIASLAKASEIDAVNYGDAIPKEYQSEVLKDYMTQMGGEAMT